MESPGSTDNGFKARVDKIFGSLAFPGSSSSSSSLQQPPLWSLAAGNVEKREWRRDQRSSYDRDETPCSSSFDEIVKKQRSSRSARKEFEDDLEDSDDGADEGGDDQTRRRDEDAGDDWNIRSSIGLDRTLDDEDEEDEYDKVALGRENAGERLYMKDVTDEGSYSGSRSELSGSSRSFGRDPRANHYGATIRLREDEVEAQNVSGARIHVSEGKETYTESSKDVVQPKPILKRKESSSDARSSKRVRFDVGSETDGEVTPRKSKDSSDDIPDVDSTTLGGQGQRNTGVPDYLLNPSKYTHYSFDSPSDVDNKSNTEACMDFLRVKGLKSTESELVMEGETASIPDKIAFIPQKKSRDVKEVNHSSANEENSEEKRQRTLYQSLSHMGIAAGGTQQSEEDATVRDGEAETDAADGSGDLQKLRRHYRCKTSSDERDS